MMSCFAWLRCRLRSSLKVVVVCAGVSGEREIKGFLSSQASKTKPYNYKNKCEGGLKVDEPTVVLAWERKREKRGDNGDVDGGKKRLLESFLHKSEATCELRSPTNTNKKEGIWSRTNEINSFSLICAVPAFPTLGRRASTFLRLIKRQLKPSRSAYLTSNKEP